MSLVNLAHVCSHLQNAAKARLGITSIPVSKMNARLMVELQKQGFLQSVVLGGPSPPVPYKLRLAPEHSVEETSSDYIQANPWAAFPEPDRRTVLQLQNFASSASSDKPEDRPGVIQELRNEFKEDVPEDYFEEEDVEEEDVAAPSPVPSHKPQTFESFVASLSQTTMRQPPLTRKLPEPLKPLKKRMRAPVDINTNVPEEDFVPTNPAQRRLWLGLKYWNSEPVISKMSLISKPTKRIWLNHKELNHIVKGRNTKQVKGMLVPGECVFVTTDRGIMEARECVERRVGGTLLCRVS